MSEIRDMIGAVLPKSWSQDRRDFLADEIIGVLDDHGMLSQDEYSAVSVADAMMPVETIEAYGLTIKLDALGEASEIFSDRGLVVLE